MDFTVVNHLDRIWRNSRVWE